METYESLFVFLYLDASVVVSDLGKRYIENSFHATFERVNS